MPSNPLNMKLFELDKNELCWLSIPAVAEFLDRVPVNNYLLVPANKELLAQPLNSEF